MRSGSRHRLVFVLIAALVAAILLSREWFEPAAPAIPGSASHAVRALADAIETGPEDVARPAPERTAATPADQAPPSPSPTLVVRLRGLHSDAPWTAALRLDLDGRDQAKDEWLDHSARLTPAADGGCTFLLPGWVATATQQKGRIEADDPNYLPLQFRWEGALDLTTELVLDVQVIAVLEGRVVTVRGEPVPAARVTAFAIRDGGPVDDKLAETNTGDDGRYRSKAPPGVPLWLVATPMQAMNLSGRRLTRPDGALADAGVLRADLLPAGRRTIGAVGSATDVGDLVLPDAGRLSGFVRWRNGTPVVGATVTAMPRGGSSFWLANDSGVQLHGDGTISPITSTPSGEDGAFVLPAVPGASVDVAVTALRDTLLIGEWPMQATVLPQRVEFSLPLPVRLRVEQGGNSVPDATIEMESPWPAKATGKDGTLSLLSTLPSLRVRGSHERLRSPWATLGPDAGGTTIVLELAEVLTEVSIDFEGDFPVRNATLTWRRDDGREGREHAMRDDRSGPFQLFLEPGRYHLRAGPGGGERDGLYLLPVERDIEVATTAVKLVLPAVFGGHFVVHATDTNGLYVRGTCRVLDASGADRTDRFVVRNDDRSANVGTPGEVMAGGPNEFATILAPGEYLLEFDFPDHGAQRQRVTIKPREVADVRIRLP